MDMLTKEQELLMTSVNDCFARIAVCTEKTSDLLAEAQWADAFHARSKNSSWLKDKTFSLGRWAVGYQYIYALYCFLDEMRPTCVLDLGLGQSTRMIAQYAAANPEVRHVVVESSLDWIEFFKNSNFALPPNTRIAHCDYGTETFKGIDGVRVYENFLSAVQGCKFDFVSIDAPLSGDMREFGRVDAIKLIPNGLSRRYAILFDDTGRKPDNAGFRALADALKDHGFSEEIGCFRGIKWCSAVVSKDLQCLLSNVSRRFDPCDPGWQREFADTAIEGDALGMVASERRKMLKMASTADMARLKEKLARTEVLLKEKTEQYVATDERLKAFKEAHNAEVARLKEALAAVEVRLKDKTEQYVATDERLRDYKETYKGDVARLKARIAALDTELAKSKQVLRAISKTIG